MSSQKSTTFSALLGAAFFSLLFMLVALSRVSQQIVATEKRQQILEQLALTGKADDVESLPKSRSFAEVDVLLHAASDFQLLARTAKLPAERLVAKNLAKRYSSQAEDELLSQQVEIFPMTTSTMAAATQARIDDNRKLLQKISDAEHLFRIPPAEAAKHLQSYLVEDEAGIMNASTPEVTQVRIVLNSRKTRSTSALVCRVMSSQFYCSLPVILNDEKSASELDSSKLRAELKLAQDRATLHVFNQDELVTEACFRISFLDDNADLQQNSFACGMLFPKTISVLPITMPETHIPWSTMRLQTKDGHPEIFAAYRFRKSSKTQSYKDTKRINRSLSL